LTVDEDSTANPGNVSGADIDGDSLTYALSTGASNGTAVVNADGSYTYTPDADFNGSDSFSFVANDGTVDSAPAAVSITVNPLNDAPTATAGSLTVDEDSTANPGNVSGADIDGDSLTYALSTGASNGTAVVNADGSYTYTPGADFNGSDSFSFVANDGTVDSVPAAVSITVTPENDLPTISGAPSTAATNGILYSFTPTADDADSDLLSFSIQNLPIWATLDTGDGTLSGIPGIDDVGGDFSSIIISVSDDGGSTKVDLPAFSITVNGAAPGSAVWDNFNWDDGSTWQ
jgi:VCBS repeat-containing protein